MTRGGSREPPRGLLCHLCFVCFFDDPAGHGGRRLGPRTLRGAGRRGWDPGVQHVMANRKMHSRPVRPGADAAGTPSPGGGGSLSKSGTGSEGGPACGGGGGLWLRLGRPVLAPPLPQQRWQCPRPPRLTARSRRLHPPFRVLRSVLRVLLGTGWQAAGHLGQLLSRCGSRRCHGRRGRPGVTAPTRPADPARPVAASVGNVLS